MQLLLTFFEVLSVIFVIGCTAWVISWLMLESDIKRREKEAWREHFSKSDKR